MSNSLAIATVTATLRSLVLGAITQAADSLTGGAIQLEVTTGRPSPDGDGITKKGVNIYLYQVSPNAALRNLDLPTRSSDGPVMQRPQLAVDLHYLLSFFGNEGQWEPQRLLGIIMKTLHSQPILSREMIVKTINTVGASSSFDFLLKSDLGKAVEQVRFTLEPFTMDELSKLWSIFFQTQYHLSVGYRASVILLDGDEIGERALPVRARSVYAIPITPPVIERVRRAGSELPITVASTIAVTGKKLWGEVTRLIIDGGAPILPLPGNLSDTEIRFDLSSLPAPLGVGIHGLQVAHMVLMGEPAIPHTGIESNLAPFVVHPRITSVNAVNIVGTTKDGVTTFAAEVTLGFSPDVGRGQRVVLLLNATSPSGTAYSFSANREKDSKDEPAVTSTIAFAVKGVAGGEYLVRAQVDGAENALLAAGELTLTVSFP